MHSVAGSLPYLTPVQRGTIGCNSLPFVCPYVHPSERLVPVQAVRVSLNPRPCNTSIMPGVQPSESLPTCSSRRRATRTRYPFPSILFHFSRFVVFTSPFSPHLDPVRDYDHTPAFSLPSFSVFRLAGGRGDEKRNSRVSHRFRVIGGCYVLSKVKHSFLY